MNDSRIARIAGACLAALFLAAAPAAAGSDADANSAIDGAINEKYVATDFDGAEADLTSAIDACSTGCSPAVVGRAWMYVGVVRGVGKQDLSGASDAFVKAKSADPNVKLDEDLSTPEVKEAFDAAVGVVAAPPPAAEVDPMECTLLPPEVQVRRAIPLQCNPPELADGGVIAYRQTGTTQWSRVILTKIGEHWQATVPCTATQTVGSLEWYASALSGEDIVAESGNEAAPNRVDLVAETAEVAPSFPGKAPPDRCPAKVAEGAAVAAGGWGASCNTDAQCAEGFLCISGGCEGADACNADSDCGVEGAYCESNLCRRRVSGGYRRVQNWIGVQASMDVTSIGGTDVCNPNTTDGMKFECFLSGSSYQPALPLGPTPDAANPQPLPGRAGLINSGMTLGTLRVMLSYERLLRAGDHLNFSVEARAGMIFFDSYGGDFIPVHAELRGKYYFGANPFETSWFRPFLAIGGGLGATSADLQTEVDDCNFAEKGTTVIPDTGLVDRTEGDAFYYQDVNAQPTEAEYVANSATQLCHAWPALPGDNPQRAQTPQAVIRTGPAFVGAGLGAMFALAEHHGIVVSVEGAMLLPTFGFSLRPTAGYAFGF